MRQPNFARLNHVLIPGTKEGRDRLRAGWLGRFSWPLVAIYGALTDEGRMLSLLTVIIGGFGIDVRNTELYVLWAMLAGALGASILVRPLYALHHVAVSVAAPRRVLLGEELVFGVTIANHGPRDLNAIRVSGPFLPWDGRWTSSSGGLARLKPGESARVELRARFVARGEHHLDPFRATALVPMGLAQGRGLATSGTRFLVLPRIARVTRVTLPETRRDQSGGVALASKTGESMELLGVRPYRPGDPIRHLHARTWARTGQPVVREYQEELFRRVAVVLDIDGADEDLREAAISLAAGVVSHLARGEAIIDLLVAGERVHDLTLGRNIGFLEQALELLACVEQMAPAARSDVNAAPKNHSPALLAQLEPHFGRLSSVVLVDAGTRSASIVARTRASGTGCLWLRVERGSRGLRKARQEAGRGTGAVVVRADAVQRGEELRALKTRALFAAPIFVALALHAWASGAYPQDVFVALLALAAIPLGGRVPLGQTAQRVFAFLSFVGGAVLGWSRIPELGYGPGTLSRSASLIAVGSLLSAVSRLYARAGWSGERATFVLATLAVAASGATRLGLGYAAFAAAYVVLALIALRARDPARARTLGLAFRHRVALVVAVAISGALTFGFVQTIPPIHDSMQRALEQKFVVHDMVGFGAGSSLGEMRDMILSDVEVLRVAPPPRSLPVDYLRGAVYDEYRSDGFWSESPFAERLRDIVVPSDLAPAGTAVRIRRVAGTAGRYFLPLDGRDVRVVTGAIEGDELGAALTVGSERATEYTFVLGTRDRLVPTPPRSLDLRVPRSEHDALAQLAGEWTAAAPTAEDKLDAIREHLDHDYKYSLTLVRDADDPLLDFLFRQRVGYCTYFASAMAMLARASGIPARLVTGYRVGEWSPIAREYVVREKNAHAWVEAWVNGEWRTYDPTPIVELPQNADHLSGIGTLAADAVVRAEHAAEYAVSHVTLAQLLGALVGLGLMWASVRWVRRRGGAAARDGRGEGVDLPLPCFASLASALERKGFPRDGAEPLGDFARRLDGSGLSDAAKLVERYAALRYGGLGDRGALERDVAYFVRGNPL